MMEAASRFMRGSGTAAMLLLLTLPAACSTVSGPKAELQAHLEREQAFELIDQGLDLRAQGLVRLALLRFDRAAIIYHSPRAFFEMGRIFESLEKPEPAAATYREALELAPDYQEARFALLAIGYRPPGYTPTSEDVELARQWAEERRQRESWRQNVQPSDRQTLQQEREQLLAEASQNRQPTMAEVRSVLFGPDERRDRLPSATEPTFPGQREVILGTAAYHLYKADQFRERKQPEKAAEEYRRALNLAPDHLEARLSLGDVMMDLERYTRARYHYEQARQAHPDSPRPLLKLGNYSLQLEQPETARQRYEQALQVDPDYAKAYNNLAVVAMNRDDYDRAAELLEKLIRLDPTYANAYLNRGIIAADVQHDRQRALECFRTYVNLDGQRSTEVRRWIETLEQEG